MKSKLAAAFVIFLSLGVLGLAHRLDEYLQAAMISLEGDRVLVSLRLIPGVAVAPAVLREIDTNGDGVISPDEGQKYVRHVLRDVTLSLDGERLPTQLLSAEFPKINDIREGTGEIQIKVSAHWPPQARGTNRKLVFENHHRPQRAAYLANCLVPQNPAIHVVAQNRNENQSFYQIDFTQAGAGVQSRWPAWLSFLPQWLQSETGFRSLFRLGMRHIAEGTDHLLFLLALLLPAPLIACRSHWAGYAGARHSWQQILRVVTAFTAGHSLTLAMAALGAVQLPSRMVEVLIAVSILISAIHALRPIFPGHEGAVAAFFGLVHGLAFATTLGDLGLGLWQRLGGIFAFNLGIESMQLIVVAATMPSLILLSRTRGYRPLRIGGALFAALASLGWIAQRLFSYSNPVDAVVDSIAHRAISIAVFLFATGLVCWLVGFAFSKTTPRTAERLSLS